MSALPVTALQGVAHSHVDKKTRLLNPMSLGISNGDRFTAPPPLPAAPGLPLQPSRAQRSPSVPVAGCRPPHREPPAELLPTPLADGPPEPQLGLVLFLGILHSS